METNCVPCGCCSSQRGDLTDQQPPGGGPMAAVLVITMQQPMGRGSRTATLVPSTPTSSPTRAHSAGRPELETAGWGGRGGDSGLRERGPPGQTDGVAHPLGAGRRLLGETSRRSEPRRLAATHASFSGPKAAEASPEWVSMTSSTILGMFRLSPFESLLKPSVCYYYVGRVSSRFRI